MKAEKKRLEELSDRLQDMWSRKDKTGWRPKGTAVGFLVSDPKCDFSCVQNSLKSSLN